jgi:nitroreductase
MMFKDLILNARSIRRFQADRPIDEQTLLELVDQARFVASARNLQPLRYIISCDPQKNDLIFPCLLWPKPWEDLKPAEHQRPTGYVVIVADTSIHTSIGLDCGIAAQTILLGAAERGLGACIIALVSHSPLRAAFNISEKYKILVVIALGYPSDTVILDERELEEDPTAFFRDEDEIWHVCKRKLKDVLLSGDPYRSEIE